MMFIDKFNEVFLLALMIWWFLLNFVIWIYIQAGL